jgi:hypothetical protein
MSDLEGRRGEFEGWDDRRKRLLLADAFNCFEGVLLPCFFGAAAIVEEYRMLPDIAQDAFIDPWFCCFQMCVAEIGNATIVRMDDPTSKDKAVLFHHQQQEYQNKASSAFQFLKDSASYGRRLGTCTPASCLEIVQLQVADLVAYEVRKLIENALYNPSIGMRWTMAQIQKHLFVCSYMDLTGKVPEMQVGPLSLFRRTAITINAGELQMSTIESRGLKPTSER